MPFSRMIVGSTVKTEQVRGSNDIFDVVVFVFVAFLASIEALLTLLYCRLIVKSLGNPFRYAQSIRLWFERRRRKPPDKISFSF